jgi:peptidoglycan/xylan/chitin deacetylase (PgdA/CDA1 family)
MSMKSALQQVFHSAGGLGLIRWRNASRNRVLTYHHFQASGMEALEEQCAHLRQHYNSVSLDEVAAFVRDGKALPRNSVAITVDDGYRDFYLYAYPVLRRHGIQATVFLMTNFLDRQEWPWWDRLRYALTRTGMDSIALEIGESKAVPYSLVDPASRMAAYDQIVEALKLVPNPVRLEFLARLPETLRVDIPSESPGGLEPMTWDEVREMASNGISFGAHTKSHPILGLVNDEQLREEIAGSKRRIEEELGQTPAHFCYPNGRKMDINDRVRSAVEEAKFSTAVSTESGFNKPGSDPFMLKRISMEAEVRPFYFRQQVAGYRVGGGEE